MSKYYRYTFGKYNKSVFYAPASYLYRHDMYLSSSSCCQILLVCRFLSLWEYWPSWNWAYLQFQLYRFWLPCRGFWSIAQPVSKAVFWSENQVQLVDSRTMPISFIKCRARLVACIISNKFLEISLITNYDIWCVSKNAWRVTYSTLNRCIYVTECALLGPLSVFGNTVNSSSKRDLVFLLVSSY